MFYLYLLGRHFGFQFSIGDHWDHLHIALDRLFWKRLCRRFHKCEFLKDKVDYLGVEVSANEIHGSPEKVKAVFDWPRPHTVHDV